MTQDLESFLDTAHIYIIISLIKIQVFLCCKIFLLDLIKYLSDSTHFNFLVKIIDFYTKNISLRDRLDNICYLSQVLNTNYSSLNLTEVLKGNIINVIRNIKLDINNEYVLINLGPEQTIYLNILARNLKTNELIPYSSVSLLKDST